MRILEEKNELQKKVHRRICMRDINFLAARPPSYAISCCFFRLLQFYVEKLILLQKMAGGETGATYLPVSTALIIKTEHLKNIYGETHVW